MKNIGRMIRLAPHLAAAYNNLWSAVFQSARLRPCAQTLAQA